MLKGREDLGPICGFDMLTLPSNQRGLKAIYEMGIPDPNKPNQRSTDYSKYYEQERKAALSNLSAAIQGPQNELLRFLR